MGDETIDNQQTTCSDALTNCSNALSTQNMSCIVDYWVDLGPIDCLKACNNGHMFTLGPPKTCLEIRLRKFDSTFGFSTTSLGKNRSVSGGGSCCVLSIVVYGCRTQRNEVYNGGIIVVAPASALSDDDDDVR